MEEDDFSWPEYAARTLRQRFMRVAGGGPDRLP
jgi:hypothetical protein